MESRKRVDSLFVPCHAEAASLTCRSSRPHPTHPMKTSTTQSAVRCWQFVACCVLLCLSFVGGPVNAQDAAAFFQDQVEPILRRRCFACHSHGATELQGGLALDWRSGWEIGGSRGPAIVPGDVDQSLLITAIRHTDSELQMPEEKLPGAEISVLTQWVASGAFDDRKIAPARGDDANALDWWSLRPLRKPGVPGDDDQNPIDAFVQEQLRQANLTPSPSAVRRTLIRRVYYDLIGLPPTPDEVDAFINDTDSAAYVRVVDRLLVSPRYGERWARHWLDTIHFADSHGYEHDVGRDNAWPFRDYVIESLNADKPWSRFVREQLAADEFFPEETSLTPALGFLGAGTFDLSTFSTAPVTFSYLDRDDMVAQTMSAFTSTTANCARCHAHKFDPITQEDYYALQAVFAGVLKGDIPWDSDANTGRERVRLRALTAAAEKRHAAVLLDPVNTDVVTSWLTERQRGATWHPLKPETYISTEGTPLTQFDDNAILAGGTAPDHDTYIVTASTQLERITALRLDLLTHESLPMNGPGRASNGNLHLTGVQLSLFEPGASQGREIAISHATADFNQTDWGIEHALDSDPMKGWGIHPAEGQSHRAVFEWNEPVAIPAGSKLVVSLKQTHGRSHLVGAFRLSVTSDEAMVARALPANVESALSIAPAERTQEQHLTLASIALKQHAEAALSKLPAPAAVFAVGPSVMIPAGNGSMQAQSLAEPKVVHLLQRGDFDKPREEVSPGALSALSHLPARFELANPQNESSRRAALAEWIVHQENTLTWRSIVNRVWHYHFGIGLCDTPSDFGRMGGVPSHPELLDWLAVWFRDDARGSLKQLHRLIVTSQTYQQSSQHRDDAAAIDGDNRLLWRQNRHRLDADAFRDFTLAVSGTIDLTMGGPGVQHFQQSKGPQSTPNLDYTAFDWNTPGASRRSIYRYVWRGIADPFMESLDFPDLGLLSPTRGFSASSLQALSLYNNDFVLHFSEKMADGIQTGVPGTDAQIYRVVRLAWNREPTGEEASDFAAFVDHHGLAALCRLLLNSNEFLFVD